MSGVERFETPPTDADVERFLDDSSWKDGATGFKELAAGECRNAWPSGARK